MSQKYSKILKRAFSFLPFLSLISFSSFLSFLFSFLLLLPLCCHFLILLHCDQRMWSVGFLLFKSFVLFCFFEIWWGQGCYSGTSLKKLFFHVLNFLLFLDFKNIPGMLFMSSYEVEEFT